MEEKLLPIPPADYQFAGLLFADIREAAWARYALLIGNLLALIPLGAGVLLLWLPYQLYLVWGAPLAWGTAVSWGWPLSIMVGLSMLLLSMPLHELLHGLALRWMGHGVAFGVEKGFLYAGIPPGEHLSRRHYFWMSLTPLLLMSLWGGLLLLILPPAAGRLLLITLLINCAASTGDLLIALLVHRWSAAAHFAPSAQGIAVFLPMSESLAKRESSQLA